MQKTNSIFILTLIIFISLSVYYYINNDLTFPAKFSSKDIPLLKIIYMFSFTFLIFQGMLTYIKLIS